MFFTHLGNKLDIIFQFIEDASTSDMVNQLAGIVTIWITITIMIKGYQALAILINRCGKEKIYDAVKQNQESTTLYGWLPLKIENR